MLILAIRTDNPTAEVLLYDGADCLAAKQWHGHRQLGETLHLTIKEVLSGQGVSIDQIEGIVAYKGPGSFTGLRIGLSVANALAQSNACPAVGVTGDDWANHGVRRLLAGENDVAVMSLYDSPVFTTKPRK